MALPAAYDSGYMLSRGSGGIFPDDRQMQLYMLNSTDLLGVYGDTYGGVNWDNGSTTYWIYRSDIGMYQLDPAEIGPWAYEEWIRNHFLSIYTRFTGANWSWVQQTALEMYNNPAEEYKFTINVEANPL